MLREREPLREYIEITDTGRELFSGIQETLRKNYSDYTPAKKIARMIKALLTGEFKVFKTTRRTRDGNTATFYYLVQTQETINNFQFPFKDNATVIVVSEIPKLNPRESSMMFRCPPERVLIALEEHQKSPRVNIKVMESEKGRLKDTGLSCNAFVPSHLFEKFDL